MQKEEIQVIKRAQTGDPLAFARLHDLYFDSIYRYFFYRVPSSAEAQVLTAELFSRLLERINLYQAENGNFLPWLYLLAHSLLAEEWLSLGVSPRKAKRNGPPWEAAKPEPTAAGQAKQQLAGLPAGEREVLVGKWIEHRASRDVAKETGRNANAIRMLQFQGLSRLCGLPSAERLNKAGRAFSHQLDEALADLASGKNISQILPGASEEAEQLAPLLQQAQALWHTPFPKPPAGAEAASKRQLMQLISEKKSIRPQLQENVAEDLGPGFRQERGKGLILVLLVLTLVFILLSTIGVAAWHALPGSSLYAVKLNLQEMHILLTHDPARQQALREAYRQLRLEDLQKAIEREWITPEDAQATMTAMPPIVETPSAE